MGQLKKNGFSFEKLNLVSNFYKDQTKKKLTSCMLPLGSKQGRRMGNESAPFFDRANADPAFAKKGELPQESYIFHKGVDYYHLF